MSGQMDRLLNDWPGRNQPVGASDFDSWGQGHVRSAKDTEGTVW